LLNILYILRSLILENGLNVIVMEQLSHLLVEDSDVQRQKTRIAESLHYAKVIQNALFPSEDLIKKTFPNHFILLLPKDILSGDFYWIFKKEKKIFFAVADCTGHGVPGALMSVMGISFLNEIVAQPCSQKPNRLLNQLREKVMKALGQTGFDDASEDGMDIALCVIDEQSGLLHYSGAYNPLYLVRKGELIIYRADNMPVGVHTMEEKPFTNNDLMLEDGDIIYLFTDGYPDQIGGPNNKKFMYNNFRDILIRVSSLPMDEQKSILKKNLLDWKANNRQIDDILVMGIKYSKPNKT